MKRYLPLEIQPRDIVNVILKHAVIVAAVIFLVCGAFAGWYLSDLGLWDHFHGITDAGPRAAFAQGYATSVFYLLWVLLLLLERKISRAAKSAPLRFVISTLIPLTFITSIPSFLAYILSAEGNASERFSIMAYQALGLAVALIVGSITVLLVFRLDKSLDQLTRWVSRYSAPSFIVCAAICGVYYATRPQPDSALFLLFVGFIVLPVILLVSLSMVVSVFLIDLTPIWTFLGAAPFVVWAFNFTPDLVPGVTPGAILAGALFTPIAYLIILYCIISAINITWRFVGMVLLLGFFIWENHGVFKYRFPGLDEYYDEFEKQQVGNLQERSWRADLPSDFKLVDPIGALDAWRKRLDPKVGKPKLVLLATSGGAYRSTFWTAVVVDELSKLDGSGRELQGFKDSIRLVTGASGGMVAGAYLASQAIWSGKHPFPATAGKEVPPAGQPDCSPEAQETSLVRAIECDIRLGNNRNRLVDRGFPRDSLTAIARQAIFFDIPGGVFFHWRWANARDRGFVLEEYWKKLDISFEELADKERVGLSPSVILTPVIVENGSPLFISNLDLLDSNQFFKLFPKSWKKGEGSFKLKTAVRMNASFPLISPAISLPTKTRLVDAGYYDNYGISAAVAYLVNPDVRQWIIENTSGVIVVLTRAFPSRGPENRGQDTKRDDNEQKEDCTQTAQDKKTSLDQFFQDVSTSFQFIETPLEGALTVRRQSMLVRNAIEFEMVGELYRTQYARRWCDRDPDPKQCEKKAVAFFDNITFAYDGIGNLTWALKQKEMDCMYDRFKNARENSEALQRLKLLWRDTQP